ncbi:YbjN domain-containing protein [Flammeovirgaceae bacterium SG7u.111]|nr:YbjN domain-containing protein [Flammeovirgaceae bacterium SG7u.132]WPO38061.1 YbjN domain-containing protein [Flammeovirgaceae bacterium SG7u.111]
MSNFEKIKGYLLELEYEIVSEDPEEEVVVVDNEDAGIKNLVIDCEEPILIIEQLLFEIKTESLELYKTLLKKNREIVHGAFTLDETGKKLLFRDTLQVENLDLNELEGSLNSLSLLLSEYFNELISFSK